MSEMKTKPHLRLLGHQQIYRHRRYQFSQLCLPTLISRQILNCKIWVEPVKYMKSWWGKKTLQLSSAPSIAALLVDMTQEGSRSEFLTRKAYLGRISIMGKC